jgi:transcriptional regulator with XRE-family HTH domain
MTPAQCRAARGLLDWTQATLAGAAGLGVSTVVRFERSETVVAAATVQTMQLAFDTAGVEFIRGRAFIFCDEVLFAGDLRAANSLKALSTTTKKGIESKGIPVVECPLGVNLWLASNSDNPIHIEEGDGRYWVLRVNEDKIGDVDYFAELYFEIEHGGREAFAHLLIARDVSNFVPKRDVPRKNEERKTQIIESLNPYDARCWLQDCVTPERFLGLETLWDTKPWVPGAEISFGDLLIGYKAWQTKVRSRAAPRPTKSTELGRILTKAKFGTLHTRSGNMRVVPCPEECLEALSTLDEDTV